MAETPQKMDFAKELVKGLTVHSSLQHEVLVMTSDRLRLCLMRHQKVLSGRTGWIAPLGLLVTILSTFLATDFNNALGLSKDTWKAIFVLGAAVSFVWLICSLVLNASSIIHFFKDGYSGTVEAIINEMRVETPKVDGQVAALFQSGTTEKTANP